MALDGTSGSDVVAGRGASKDASFDVGCSPTLPCNLALGTAVALGKVPSLPPFLPTCRCSLAYLPPLGSY